jgi:hypothetical protein
MIEVSMITAAMLYLAITLGVLLGIWSYHHYRSRSKKMIILEEELRLCEYCHFAYLSDRAKAITKCPQCASYNRTYKE